MRDRFYISSISSMPSPYTQHCGAMKTIARILIFPYSDIMIKTLFLLLTVVLMKASVKIKMSMDLTIMLRSCGTKLRITRLNMERMLK